MAITELKHTTIGYKASAGSFFVHSAKHCSTGGLELLWQDRRTARFPLTLTTQTCTYVIRRRTNFRRQKPYISIIYV